MVTNGASDLTPVPEVIVRNPANKELITFLANMIVETRQQVIQLRDLYSMLKDFETPVPKSWAHKLADSQQHHINRATETLDALKSAIG
jgi:hypothetical protein